jgi:hypothetical protein
VKSEDATPILRVVEELLTYRTSTIIPNIEERLFSIREFVQSLLEDAKSDNSDRHRLRILLKKLPVVGETNNTAQQG